MQKARKRVSPTLTMKANKQKNPTINSKIPSFLEPFRALRLQDKQVAGNLIMDFQSASPREMGPLQTVSPAISRCSPQAEETVREDRAEDTFEEIVADILQK